MRLALLPLLLLALPAAAQQRVTVQGCPLPGTESGCMVLRSAEGWYYDLSAARQRPPINGRGIRVTGTRAPRTSYCQQGEPLVDVTWEQTSAACPGR